MASTVATLAAPTPVPPTATQAAIRAMQTVSAETTASIASVASGTTEGAGVGGGFVDLTV